MISNAPSFPTSIETQETFEQFVAFSRQLMDFQDIGWWCIHYTLDPAHFYCNAAMTEMFGLDAQALRHAITETCPIAGDYSQHVAKVDAATADRIFAEYDALLKGQADAYDNVFPYQQGDTIRHFRSQAKVLQRDDAGRPTLIHGLIIEITAQRALQRQLRADRHHFKRQSQVDPLTGLYNRRLILQRCEHLLRRAQRDKHPFAIWYLDLDQFKRINDEAGHTHGDRVLRQFAQQLRCFFNRTHEIAGRLGGEEFLACTVGADMNTLHGMTARFHQQLRQKAIPSGRNDASPLTISGGVVCWIPDQPPCELDALIRQADLLLYEAKQAGRDQLKVSLAIS